MNYTTLLLKKGEGLILMIYKVIADKFINLFKQLKDRVPIINRYPLLKYSLIPVSIALFFLARYIIKFVINELAAYTSGFVREISGYPLSEGTIFLIIAVLFIIIRIAIKYRNKGNKKVNQLELSYEKTK